MKKFQILSLDGGGIRGLFSAAVLAHFEADHGISVTDHFDLIVGTSTGGIIALGLGIGLKPKEIVEFYLQHGNAIFPNRFCKNFRWYCAHPKYDNAPLKKALEDCFGEFRMADSRRPLVIPSYNIGKDDLYLFKTPHHADLKRDWRVPMWKVGMATSAAPTYFPAFKGVDNMRLIDGGVCANNPAMVGLVEAIKRFDVPLDAVRICSVGTTDDLVGRPESLDTAGALRWLTGNGVQVFMRGQSLMTNSQVELLVGKENVARLDPSVPDGFFEMDKLTLDELLAEASHESRKFTGIFETFLDHQSFEYEPIYS